jgi:hypothetical protein
MVLLKLRTLAALEENVMISEACSCDAFMNRDCDAVISRQSIAILVMPHSSFDHLVGVRDEYSRHIEAERPGRLEIAHSPRPRAYRFVCLHGREDEGRSAAHAMEPIT